MTVWWLTLVITFLLSTLARAYSKKNNINQYKPNKMLSILACGILIVVSGLRITEGYMSIGDTSTYSKMFKALPINIVEYLSNNNLVNDWGFSLLQVVIKMFITQDVQVYFLICSFITITLIFVVLYKYCGMLEIGVFTFIAAGNYCVSMNGVRQYLVSAILFFSFPLIYKKNWKLYFPIVLLVSTMHNSALIFIPLYFIINKPAWGIVTKLILGGGVGVYLTYPITGKLILLLLGNSEYGSTYSESLSSASIGGGANFTRVLLYSVPVGLAYLTRNKICSKEKYYNIVVNFSALNLIFMLMANTYWIYARYCIYFSLYMIILFCWCLKYSFDNKSKLIAYWYYIFLFCIYFWYEIAVSQGQIYISNYIK